MTGMLGTIAAPVVIGTGLVILVNWPSASAAVRVAESALWVFAAIGALVGGASAKAVSRAVQLRWFDAVALLVATLLVRLLVPGIPFVP